MSTSDPFGARTELQAGGSTVQIHRLGALQDAGVVADLQKLPYSIRVLLEAALRNVDGFVITEDDVRKLASWGPDTAGKVEIPFKPSRVVLQDFTGVPCVVDLAAMRAAMQELGGDPKKINPLVPCDLVIDHSVQVDHFGSDKALERNIEIEFERNKERYEFLKWGQQAFQNFRCVPPATGIVHQVNLEYLAHVVMTENGVAYPDSCVGTDSHTTMINGLGVVGWGVGGIEAEAVMLGQPVYMLMPEVIGFELTGKLAEGSTATDLVLTVVEMLRQKGVVGKFVEFYGDGLAHMSLADRATIANMAPEYGATMGFFPIDEEALNYMRLTGRPDDQVELVRKYYEAQGMFWNKNTPAPEFTDTLSLDLATVVPSLAGPKRPQDRIALTAMKESFQDTLRAPVDKRGFALDGAKLEATGTIQNGTTETIGHGAVVIAAITSCTNTSNPDVLVAAGLVAKKAREKGLKVSPHVKTSLAPGSRVVTDYLEKCGLDQDLDALGFQTVGYGCTTCIGNSGPLPEAVSNAVRDADLVATSVLSGNRNFEGRINPDVKANYLASPPLVVAYAIAGTIDIDLTKDALGTGTDGAPVYLQDIWPTLDEVRSTVRSALDPEMFRQRYGSMAGPEAWQRVEGSGGELYDWKETSTYIQQPPFFVGMAKEASPINPIAGARCLVKVADSTTTDHISPAGAIKPDSAAGRYLQEQQVAIENFNSYGSRRGNDRVMTRGTFANVRLRNQMAPGTEGGFSRYLPTGEQTTVFEAAERYRQDGTPLMVLAGKEYGTGSSRDWAAKGTLLLGVRFVLAESFERIHRSNLVGMGVLPLCFREGESVTSLGLTGEESFDVAVGDDLKPRQELDITATNVDGSKKTFQVVCRIDTPVEVDYYRNGGILHTVLRRLARD